MPARIAVVHDEPAFVDEVTAALRIAGYDTVGFTDPMGGFYSDTFSR